VLETEYQDCRHKARALFRAAEGAVRYASMPARGSDGGFHAAEATL
jgi:hypothetical protein